MEETNVTETPEEVVSTEVENTDVSDQEVIEKSLIDMDDTAEEESADEKEEGDSEKFETPNIELPEGIEFDTVLFEKVTPTLQKLGATQDDVNELTKAFVDHQAEAAKIHGDKLVEKYNEIKEDWKAQTQKEFGADLKPTLNVVGKTLKQFGTPELVELFNETGVGNHPELIKCFAKIGKNLVEDDFVDGQTKNELSIEDSLYPTMK